MGYCFFLFLFFLLIRSLIIINNNHPVINLTLGVKGYGVNTTFNNISIISWWLVLLVEEVGETHRPVASHLEIYHIMMYQVHLDWAGFELTTSVVINCIGNYKSNYHAILTSTTQLHIVSNA